MKKDKSLNGVNINGNLVYVENGVVKTQLCETIQEKGYMSVEEAVRLTTAKIKMIYELHLAL